jgi:DnaJ-class molecular chaperone
MKTYYELLNIEEDADKKTIKRAFYRLAKQYHPDLSKDGSTFISILNAYETLIDDEKRKAYNILIGKSRRADYRVLPKSRITFALSLQDVVASKYFHRGNGRWTYGYNNYKGFDVLIEITEEELRTGSIIHVEAPAHVVCPLCKGDRVPCTFCSGKGYILRAVSVPVSIPDDLEDDDVFSVPLRKIKQKEFAFFRIEHLYIKIKIIQE